MIDRPADTEILFEVDTPLGFQIRTTVEYWQLITTVKHPIMKGKEADVQATLSGPDEVRQSKSDPQVYLFYRASEQSRWVCAVTKRLNGEGFLITAYRTSAIKEGVIVWPKS
jgi:hypothetical protein